MSQLPKGFLSSLDKVLEMIGVDYEEKVAIKRDFEETLLARFSAAAIQKLSSQEQKEIVELANAADTDEKKQELQKKLFTLLNAEEVKGLMQKSADKLFGEFLQNLYNETTDEQKGKLEEMFKPEVLKG